MASMVGDCLLQKLGDWFGDVVRDYVSSLLINKMKCQMTGSDHSDGGRLCKCSIDDRD